jgi:hypothetical protein
VTLSDLDLETRLRAQRTRAEETPPAPSDLVQRVRERAREQRRRRLALIAAGVAAALVFVGLPTLASGLVGEGSRGEAAAPSSPSRTRVPSNFDYSTRGSLAGDADWVDGVRTLSWRPEDWPETPQKADPELENRRVAFAGDVPGGRVALVLGRLGDGSLVQAWYTGPTGAAPEDMVLAGMPWGASRQEPMALWTAPDPASDRATLVVVSRPGDQVEVLTGRDVAASGEIRETWKAVPMEDGAGAMTLGSTVIWPFGAELPIRRIGQQRTVYPQVGDRAVEAAGARLEVADPRGLRTAVRDDDLQWAVQSLVAHYGLPADRLRPTLLVAGPVAGASGMSAVLVGVTFPSGAVAVHLVTHQEAGLDAPDGTTSTGTSFDPVPAGPPLLDRVLAVPSQGSIVISAPAAGVLAEVYLGDGSLLTSLPLVHGVGSGLLPPPAAMSVRILDATGDVVAEAPLMGQDG